ncbi:MAG: hemerythrin family protein [Betaproteobacteria bacterium]|nr:hemerythrin family protein [Betaproteobacteria bacterium]
MAFMEWSQELELGFEEIDRQHRWLVEATNALHEELQKGEPKRERLDVLIGGLVIYARNHFATEERLFERYQYPLGEAHHKEHVNFAIAAREWKQRHESGELLGQEVLDFLKHWLLYHILKSDKAYAPFLKSHGVK